MKKEIIIDWDSFDEMVGLFSKVKCRYLELYRLKHPEIPSRKQKNRELFDACQQILSTDISHVYQGMALDPLPRYYVYAHTDSNRKVAVGINGLTSFAATLGCSYFPFYIGKGTGSRCYDLSRNGEHGKIVKRLKLSDGDVVIRLVKENLTESEALQLESKLIDIFGLRPYGGMLSNLDEGMLAEQRRALYRDAFLKLRPFNVKL